MSIFTCFLRFSSIGFSMFHPISENVRPWSRPLPVPSDAGQCQRQRAHAFLSGMLSSNPHENKLHSLLPANAALQSQIVSDWTMRVHVQKGLLFYYVHVQAFACLCFVVAQSIVCTGRSWKVTCLAYLWRVEKAKKTQQTVCIKPGENVHSKTGKRQLYITHVLFTLLLVSRRRLHKRKTG